MHKFEKYVVIVVIFINFSSSYKVNAFPQPLLLPNLGIGHKDPYSLNFATTMMIKDENTLYPRVDIFNIAVTKVDSKYRLTSNGLLALSGLAFFSLMESVNEPELAYFILIPYMLTNLGVEYAITPKIFTLNAKINTDYFLFYHDSCIYSELSAGIRLTKYKYQPTIDIRFPILKGYHKNMDPYIFLSLVFDFN